MGGDAARRNAFVSDATQGMAVDAVIDLVKAAADANGQTISHGLVRMLTKLSAHAEAGQEAARPAADSALREQVQSLLSEWNLADPNPDDYRQMLQYLATSATPAEGRTDVGGRSEGAAPGADVARGRARRDRSSIAPSAPASRTAAPSRSLRCSNRRRRAARVAAERLRARLTQPLAIGTIASREPLDEPSLDFLMPSLSLRRLRHAARRAGLIARAASRAASCSNRLARTSLDVVALVASRLEDDRWYVQRNMLLLLGRMGRVPADFSMTRWTTHADPRIRSEALRLQMSLPGQRELALRTAFNDADARVVRVGVASVQHDCPPRVLGFVAGLAQGVRVPEDLRLLAVQALGSSRDSAALDALVAIADGGKSVFGRQKLAAKSIVMLAALRALAAGWRAHPRAEPLLAAASTSPDDDIRDAIR